MTAPLRNIGRSRGFGIERIGLLPIRSPLAATLLIAAITLIALVGLRQVQTGGTLLALFRSDSPEYARFDDFQRHFPASDRDVLLTVHGGDIFSAPQNLERLRALHIELQLSDAAESVLSLFTVPDKPRADGYAPPLIPDLIPSGAELEALVDRVENHPLIKDRLLSRRSTGDAVLIVVTLTSAASAQEHQSASLAEIAAVATETLAGSGMTYTLSGTPVMEIEIRESGTRDRVLFNAVGLLVGLIICAALFRRLRPVAIVAACPVIALLWALGVFGWLGLELSTISNAVLPLVIALTFCDAMHMVFAMRRRIAAGASRKKAAISAVLDIGPACVLTSLTTSLALLSLLFADSRIIGDFALSAAVATIFALLSVLLLTPLLGVALLSGAERKTGAGTNRPPARGVNVRLEQASASLGAWIPRHGLTLSVAGAALALVSLSLHLRLEPAFRLSAQLPDSFRSQQHQALAASGLELTYPLQVVVTQARGATPAQALATVRAVHELLEAQPLVRNIWSAELLRRWIDSDEDDVGPVATHITRMPQHLKQRFQSSGGDRMLVTGYLPDLQANETLALLAAVEKKLRSITREYPGFSFSVTGLTALAAENSARIIQQLNLGLLGAILLVCALLGLAFRSLAVPLVSLVPNVLPLTVVGAVLYAAGKGLDYTTLIALTVAFGIAVDNAIHVLNRLRLERRKEQRLDVAVSRTVARIGPVLLATTLVLMFGIGATVASELPPTREFGALCLSVLATALASDLLLLPALVLTLDRFRALPPRFLKS